MKQVLSLPKLYIQVQKTKQKKEVWERYTNRGEIKGSHVV